MRNSDRWRRFWYKNELAFPPLISFWTANPNFEIINIMDYIFNFYHCQIAKSTECFMLEYCHYESSQFVSIKILNISIFLVNRIPNLSNFWRPKRILEVRHVRSPRRRSKSQNSGLKQQLHVLWILLTVEDEGRCSSQVLLLQAQHLVAKLQEDIPRLKHIKV